MTGHYGSVGSGQWSVVRVDSRQPPAGMTTLSAGMTIDRGGVGEIASVGRASGGVPRNDGTLWVSGQWTVVGGRSGFSLGARGDDGWRRAGDFRA